jgi:hypothetical protein
MSRIALNGNPLGTGTFTITSPNSNSDFTLTLPSASGTVDVFPSGTKMLFQQTAAPTGWTKDTTHNNKALRVVSGTASTGGTVDFTTVFSTSRDTSTVTATGTVGNTTLTTAQMPSHTHNASSGVFVTNLFPSNSDWAPNSVTGNLQMNGGATASTGSSNSHNHSFTGTGHFHATNLNVQYVDLIIATKN